MNALPSSCARTSTERAAIIPPGLSIGADSTGRLPPASVIESTHGDRARPPAKKFSTFSAAEISTPSSSESCGTLVVAPYVSPDRKRGVSGKSVSVRVDLGGRRVIKKHTERQDTDTPR